MSAAPASDRVVISWTTDEPADSQIEYGLTQAYGASTPLDATLVTAHTQTILALNPSTAHHFRIRSRDAAGNAAVSDDRTFDTSASPDAAPPTVEVTVPAANATVSGLAMIAAAAQDDIGVAGVQFFVDGVAEGAEDASSPYNVSWDSTLQGNGTHLVTATARDAAGKTATSSSVAVVVQNAASDTNAPAVTVASPADGAVLVGEVTITADASDDVGVVGVQFLIDDAELDVEDLTAPYTARWDTRQVANGARSIAARARDAAGNVGASVSVSVTVNNSSAPPGAAIDVGSIELDPPTIEALGMSLPIVSGDVNYNAVVSVKYRPVGETVWRGAQPLFRVRPEFLSEEDPTPFTIGPQFAGSIFDLQPDTEYEIELSVVDPDGGSVTRNAAARTRAVPLANPTSARQVPVATLSALNDAIADAAPGDVITIAEGTYAGSISISRSGTPTNPIFIRGVRRDGVILNAAGASAGVTVSGRYVTVEHLTISRSTWGVRIPSSDNVVLRRLRITDVSQGVEIRGDAKRNHYVCDNVLEGREAQWPETDSSVWDFEGIVVTGEGHVICHNTLSGFGDAMGMHHTTSIPNRANDFYGNDVLWTGDNGIEVDFGERNVRALRNRFTNGGNHSMSFQPIYGGPAYAIRNVMYNSATAPFKFNNEPTGIIALHNTAVRPGSAWTQLGARADNLIVLNNIFIGTSSPVVNMTTAISVARIDSNGYRPDGTFRFFNVWNSFAELQSNSPYESHGRLLDASPFATPPSIPPTHTTFVAPLDAALGATTDAADAASRLPNVNDEFVGSGPDLGALERGAAAPVYGVRPE